MNIYQKKFIVQTVKRGTVDITHMVANFVKDSTIHTGLCHIFLPHTSASLIFCENADPTVRSDLEAFISRLIPDGDPLFQHINEGLDDMPAHIRTILTQNMLSVPICNNVLTLGTWQGIYLWEHRTTLHQRTLIITITGKSHSDDEICN